MNIMESWLNARLDMAAKIKYALIPMSLLSFPNGKQWQSDQREINMSQKVPPNSLGIHHFLQKMPISRGQKPHLHSHLIHRNPDGFHQLIFLDPDVIDVIDVIPQVFSRFSEGHPRARGMIIAVF